MKILKKTFSRHDAVFGNDHFPPPVFSRLIYLPSKTPAQFRKTEAFRKNGFTSCIQENITRKRLTTSPGADLKNIAKPSLSPETAGPARVNKKNLAGIFPLYPLGRIIAEWKS
ncbi:MAG: hypothetical protein AB1461_00085 [Thermodesulfobacteriota bacterium]